MNKGCKTGLMVYLPYPGNTRKSNRLQMTLERQYFLVSYLRILIEYWSGQCLKPRPAALSRPMLIHLSYQTNMSRTD